MERRKKGQTPNPLGTSDGVGDKFDANSRVRKLGMSPGRGWVFVWGGLSETKKDMRGKQKGGGMI